MDNLWPLPRYAKFLRTSSLLQCMYIVYWSECILSKLECVLQMSMHRIWCTAGASMRWKLRAGALQRSRVSKLNLPTFDHALLPLFAKWGSRIIMYHNENVSYRIIPQLVVAICTGAGLRHVPRILVQDPTGPQTQDLPSLSLLKIRQVSSTKVSGQTSEDGR